MRLDDALTARIAATKRRLLAGGVLQPIQWGVPLGERDERGRITYAYSDLDALIEERPALDRGTLDTNRADNTVVVILDPVAITDEHLFRWGDPPHTYKVKAIDGLLQNEETLTRDRDPLGQVLNPRAVAGVECRQIADARVPPG